MDGSAGEDGGGEGEVGAAVEAEGDVSAEEFAVFADGGADAGAAGVALGGCGEVFGAVVADFDGVAGLHGEQGGVGCDDGGEVFFAAEGSTGLGLDDAALFGGQVEDELEGVDDVEGALHGAADGDTVGGGVLGDDAVVFDVELLLGSGAVLAGDDVVGSGEDGVELGLVAGAHEVGLEEVFFGRVGVAPDGGCVRGFGLVDGEDGGEGIVGDVDGGDGGGEDGAVGVGEQEDGLVGVVDVGGGEAEVVFGDVDDGVFAGDVGGGDDGELVPGDGGIEGDGGDASAGDGGADGGAEPHVGKGDVVDVLSAAEDLGDALLADGGGAYDMGGLRRHKNKSNSTTRLVS